MTRPDDSNLHPRDLQAIEEHARKLLDRADAWNRLPTPIDDIVTAANLTVAPTSLFDPAHLLAYLRNKAVKTGNRLKKAIGKIFGLYDAAEFVIHIDEAVSKSKQGFLKLHETGHHEIPTHRKLFRFFEDSKKTLAPEIADRFEREANNFARFCLFQGDSYRQCAADLPFGITAPIKLARTFGASIYASAREYARTSSKACVVYALEPIEYVSGSGAQARVRRIVASPSFINQFGEPTDTLITLDHTLGEVLPVGRRMTRPVSLSIPDLNGNHHECLAEAFDTKWNVFILLHSIQTLNSATIVMPSGYALKSTAH